MLAIAFQLPLNLKAGNDEIERVGYELRNRGSCCARGRMAEGWERRADSAVMMLIGDVVQSKCILIMSVHHCRGTFDELTSCEL